MNEVFYSDDAKIESVYVVLSQTRTVPARLIRLYTGKPYAHASISVDKELDEMYSFARRGIWNPFNAGFIKEDISTGIFGKFNDTVCCVYRIRVTKEQYNKVRSIVNIFKNDHLSYSYSFLGILGAAVHYPVTRSKKYFCSQFVAYVLQAAGINIFSKVPALIRPDDLRKCEAFEPIYVGKLSDYRTYVNNDYVAIS